MREAADKRLITLLGANGVGKSTTSRLLNRLIPDSAYIDMEYCCALNPFRHTEDTIPFIQDNMYALLANCMTHSCVHTILLPYGLHGARAQIYQNVLQKLRANYAFSYHPIVLECAEEENIARMRADQRDEARIRRALEHSNVYRESPFPRIDTTGKSAAEAAQAVLALLK